MHDPVHMAKTHEILARFRPIAPKPSHPPPPPPDAPSPRDTAASSSLYRCVPRSCRSRKRGRGNLGSPSNKRQRTIFPLLPAAVPPPSYNHRAPAVPFPGVAPKKSTADELLTLSLRPRSFNDDAPPLVEQDLLQKLQDQQKVIAPQPVRPVGSSISVTLISPHVKAEPTTAPVARRREEVEAEVESDALPAVVSDWRNRVRLANSAYKEMVGQPECPWIDAMVMAVDGGRGPATRRRPRRISGEVMLDVEESAMPKTAAGFSCRARIEWACNGRKNCVTAPCSVIRLFCESNDYLFAWRFDTCKATAEDDDDCTSPASVLVASIGMYN